MTGVRPARVVVEALRLDREDLDEVHGRVERAIELGVGGFVLFGGVAARVAELTDRIRQRAGRDLWIAADLERGAGQQFRGLDELPPPAALGRHVEPDRAARRAARLTARQALSVGVNWVLAPVLDLDLERENPIVATRSFGDGPEAVARLGRAWVDACQGAGALACVKHFPGHGRTLADSHIELPVVDATREELRMDLRPFAECVASVGSVMIAHVAYPAYGCEGPATESAEVVHGLLRETLGFDRLVATDAMIMAGVGDNDAEAAVAAIRAGCDVILYPSDVRRTVERLERAADADPEFAGAVGAAVGRSVRELARFPGTAVATTPARPEVSGLELAEETIIAEGVDLSRWNPGTPTEVVAVADDPEIGPPAGRDGPLAAILDATLSAAGWQTRLRTATPDAAGGAAATGGLTAAPGKVAQRIVVLAATPRGWKGHGGPSAEVAERVRTELESAERALLVLLGHARWIGDLGGSGLCAWSTESVMERAAARWVDRHTRDGSSRTSGAPA
ncbi:MAG: glycoside hydrolase family 3 N-terminal domain-containing protein [Gemmatimonadota bacterium]|nr:glycoside hydrolase family 3 N-terminal domain-containing protein [Gemmatimonadota bacterium]